MGTKLVVYILISIYIPLGISSATDLFESFPSRQQNLTTISTPTFSALNLSSITVSGQSILAGTTNNVGIGIYSPTSKFHVVGNSFLNGQLNVGDLIITTNSITGSTGTFTGNAFSVGGSTFVVTFSSVGIRVTPSQAALDVNGSVQFGSIKKSTFTTSGNLQLASALTPIYGGSGSDLSATGGSNQFVRQTSIGGNFTVGTIATTDMPSDGYATTYVNITGDNMSGQLTLNNSSLTVVGPILIPSTFTVIQSSVGVRITSPTSGLDVRASAAFGATTQSTFSATGELTLTSPLTIANGGTGRSNLGTGILRGNGTNNIGTLTGTANRAAVWTTVSTITASFIIFDDGVNVGINDTTPSANLDINGLARIAGTKKVTDGRNALNLIFDPTANVAGINSQNNQTVITYLPLKFDSDSLFLNTESKGKTVVISSLTNASSDFHIMDTAGTNTYLLSSSQTTTGWGIVHTTTGLVGIQAQTPISTFTAYGSILLSTSSTAGTSLKILSDGSSNTGTLRYGQSGNYTTIGSGGDLEFVGTGDYLVARSGTQYAFRYAGNENAGLRFNTATGCIETMDTSAGSASCLNAIVGDNYFRDDLAVGETAATARLESKSSGNTSATFGFGVQDSGGNFYLIGRDDRRIGINTTGPLAHLHITATGANPSGDVIMISSANATTHYMVIRSSNGHVEFSGTSPTIQSCGTSPALQGNTNDMAGRIKVGTSPPTGCNIKFGGSWSSLPICMVNDDTRFHNVSSTVTTSVLSIVSSGTLVANDVLSWICFGTR